MIWASHRYQAIGVRILVERLGPRNSVVPSVTRSVGINGAGPGRFETYSEGIVVVWGGLVSSTSGVLGGP